MKFTDLETLEGVGPAVAKKLREAGILCVESLAILSVRELDNRTRIGEGTSQKILKRARETLGIGLLDSGTVREDELLRRRKLTTGLTRMDDGLRGGFKTGSVVEFYGPSRSSKSLWCHHLAVTNLLPEERKGLNGNVLWLDTESSFSPRTIRANALRWGLDPDSTLERIKVLTVLNRDQLTDHIRDLPRIVVEQDVSLIVIDNLGKFFRLDIEGLENHRWLSNELLRIFETLCGVALMLDCVIVYTNQVYHQLSMWGGNRNAPVGDALIGHMPTHRFFVKPINNGKRKLTLKDNVGLPEFDMETHIGWGGIFEDRHQKRVIESVISDYLDRLLHSSTEAASVEDGA